MYLTILCQTITATVSSACRDGICCLIRVYQRIISPHCCGCCRFFPSCSQYMIDAIHARGVIGGIGAGLYRLIRCHRWAQGGYDPVTPREKRGRKWKI